MFPYTKQFVENGLNYKPVCWHHLLTQNSVFHISGNYKSLKFLRWNCHYIIRIHSQPWYVWYSWYLQSWCREPSGCPEWDTRWCDTQSEESPVCSEWNWLLLYRQGLEAWGRHYWIHSPTETHKKATPDQHQKLTFLDEGKASWETNKSHKAAQPLSSFS